MAGECELNRGGDLGTEADVFCLLENDWNRGIGSLGHLSNELNNKKGEKYLGMRMNVVY